MNFQNDRYTLRFAEDCDNDGIREIFESEGFGGNISIQYLRGKKPLDSFKYEGDRADIMVITDNEENRMIAVGGAVVRMEYVNGRAEKCGYLTGLKIHPDYRGKIRFIAKAYQFLHDKISDCYCFYTTILDDNKGAIALLEKRHKNMPEYRYIGHYTTYCFHGGKKILSLDKNNTEGFDELLRTHFSALSFTPADYRCCGFGRSEFYSIRENGKIIACCLVGNQQEHKQYRMCSYGGIYKLIAMLPTKLLGYPSFPKPDSLINYGTVAYLYVRDNDQKLCADFLRSVAAESGFDLLIWGGFENNPLCKALDAMKTVHYGSRLYSVSWDKDVPVNGVIGIEAALL